MKPSKTYLTIFQCFIAINMQLLRQFHAYEFDQYLWLNIIDSNDEDEPDDFCRFRQLCWTPFVFVDFISSTFVACNVTHNTHCFYFRFLLQLFFVGRHLHLFCGNLSALNFACE